MKVIDKENNIVEDICPSCGKDGATIQTTEYGDGSKYIEVMCLNGCGHFARIIKRESELINEQNTQTNEDWFCSLPTEEKAEWIANDINERVKLALHDSELNDGDVDADYYMEDADDWSEWLKQPHKEQS